MRIRLRQVIFIIAICLLLCSAPVAYSQSQIGPENSPAQGQLDQDQTAFQSGLAQAPVAPPDKRAQTQPDAEFSQGASVPTDSPVLLVSPVSLDSPVPLNSPVPLVSPSASESSSAGSSLLGRWKIAPELTLSVPQPLMIGIEVHRNDQKKVKYYLDAGFFQFPFSIVKRGIHVLTIEPGIRYSPFENWLYLSVGLGYRKVQYYTSLSSFTLDGNTFATGGILNVSTLYVSPMIEARWNISKRIDVMLGIGAQISLIGSGGIFLENKNNGTNSDNSSVLSVDSKSDLDRLAYFLVPRLTLFRFIWNFD